MITRLMTIPSRVARPLARAQMSLGVRTDRDVVDSWPLPAERRTERDATLMFTSLYGVPNGTTLRFTVSLARFSLGQKYR